MGAYLLRCTDLRSGGTGSCPSPVSGVTTSTPSIGMYRLLEPRFPHRLNLATTNRARVERSRDVVEHARPRCWDRRQGGRLLEKGGVMTWRSVAKRGVVASWLGTFRGR